MITIETRETKIGVMFDVITPYNKDDENGSLWIRAADIIGLSSWTDRNRKYHYAIRVNFIVGGGINSGDQLLEVTQESYNTIALYLNLPVIM